MVPEFLKRERYGDGGERRSAKTRLRRLAEKKSLDAKLRNLLVCFKTPGSGCKFIVLLLLFRNGGQSREGQEAEEGS